MDILNLSAELSVNAYPGRGIIAGITPNGKNAVIAYFIMGRSENSRNRIFSPTKDGIETMAADPSKLTDPSLIIYTPVRILKHTHIVTNGDQTDTIFGGMKIGKNFARTLRKRTFEPDAPNYTPRISCMVKVKNEKLIYKMAILKAMSANPESLQRIFYEYPEPVNGTAHFIHTYKCDGNPIPSFYGEPALVNTENNQNEFVTTLWNSLNADNKVSLFVRYIDIKTGKYKDIIKNKYNKAEK